MYDIKEKCFDSIRLSYSPNKKGSQAEAFFRVIIVFLLVLRYQSHR